jgi:hypothetical protein
MPVLLADENDFDAWLTGSVEEALALQKPRTGPLDIVATGIERQAG